ILMAELPSRAIVRRRFDLFGFAMIAICLSSLQLMLDRGTHLDWFASLEIWVYAFLVLSTAWAAVIHFVTAPQPLFDRQLFANVNLVVAVMFMIVIGALMFATMALLPPMLQGLFG